MNKKLVIFCIVVMLSMFLIIGAQAAEKKVLRVSTWGGMYQHCYEATVGTFEKENNVEVEWILGDSALWNSKARLGQIDVVTSDVNKAIGGLKEGLWLLLDETKIPNMANLYDNARENEYTVWSNVGDYVLAYNSNKIPTPPTSWEDMWDDAYHQKVVLYSFNDTGTLSLVLQLAEKYGGGIDNIKPGLDKLVELYKKGNIVAMVAGDAEMQTLMQLEEAWLSMLCNGRVFDLQQKGVDFVKIARPKEGTYAMISTVQVAKMTKEPDLAMKFINYVLSPECQEMFAEKTYYAPTVRNAKIPSELEGILLSGEDIENLYIPDWEKVNEVKEQWVEMWERAIHQ